MSRTRILTFFFLRALYARSFSRDTAIVIASRNVYTYSLFHPPGLTDAIHALDRGIVTGFAKSQLHLPILLVAGASGRAVRHRRHRRCRYRRRRHRHQRQRLVTRLHPGVTDRHRVGALRYRSTAHEDRVFIAPVLSHKCTAARVRVNKHSLHESGIKAFRRNEARRVYRTDHRVNIPF